MSKLSQRIGQIIAFDGVHLFNSLILGEPPKHYTGLQNLAQKNKKHHSIMWCTA